MLRQTRMLKWRDGVGAEQKLRAKESLAYLAYACDLEAIDFGEDLRISVPTNFDLVVITDHASREKLAAQEEHPEHHRVSAYLASVTRTDEAVTVLSEYDGPPTPKGGVRHTALFRWNDGVTEAQKIEDWRLARSQVDVMPWVRHFSVRPDISGNRGNYDWVLEAHFDDVEGCLAMFDHPRHKDVSDLNHSLTQDPITARVQHRMRMG